jgi:opacity protein-like surface antigen
MLSKTKFAAASVFFIVANSHAYAADVASDECSAPCLAYELTIETDAEAIFAHKPDRTETLNIGPSNSLTLTATPVENLNFVADFVLEPVLDADIDHVNVFEDIGLYNDELYVDYTADAFYLQLGKFTPAFSLASDELGGYYGSEFASSFDANESWAAAAALTFEAANLHHRLSASAFTRDRTILSESAFTNRGRTRLSDGGAGNVKGIGSAQLLLDGCSGTEAADCWSDGAWGYRLGARWQEMGAANDDIDNPKDEWAFTAAAFHKLDVGERSLKILAETGYSPSIFGSPDGMLVGTLGLELEAEPITYYAAVSLQENMLKDATDTTGFAIDLAADYAFAENWTLGAGYAYVDTGDDEAAHFLNMSLKLELSGNTGG